MSDNNPTVTDAVRHLMTMNSEVVSAKYIAPILKMSESVIVKYAKDGTWDQDKLGKFVISGGHVKFFRKDFLQKCGFLEPEKAEPTVEQLLMRVIQLLMDMNWLLAERLNEKTADAATPTD